MSEGYEEVASPHQWRDPAIAWPIFLASYLIAIVLFFLLAAAEATAWGYYAGLFRITADDAARFDSVVRPLNDALLPVFVVCAVATSFLTYRTFANAHAAGAQNRLTGPLLAAGAYYMPFVGFFIAAADDGQAVASDVRRVWPQPRRPHRHVVGHIPAWLLLRHPVDERGGGILRTRSALGDGQHDQSGAAGCRGNLPAHRLRRDRKAPAQNQALS